MAPHLRETNLHGVEDHRWPFSAHFWVWAVAGEAACRWARAVFFFLALGTLDCFSAEVAHFFANNGAAGGGNCRRACVFLLSQGSGLARSLFYSTFFINDGLAQLVCHWDGLRFFVFAAAKGSVPSLNWVRAFIIRRSARAKISSSSVAFGFFA
jgi:hypothetical protein